MIRTRRKGSIALTMLSGIALVAVACSNDSSSASAGASGSTTGAPATLNVELDWVPNPDHVGL
jgi:ABC-type nitrate/sulfonate/bicarbonate transport system substrate-binding protein